MPTKREPRQKVTFALLAPEAQQVSLLGDFSGWEQQPVSMKKLKDGRWQATLALAEGKYEYRYLVDGQWRDDPDCPTRAPNAFGSENCVRVVS
jgi:1,4-alpha-glucan branching enzyme